MRYLSRTHDERRPPADRGFTLVEAVIAVSLTGLVVTGILASVQALITASSVAYDSAEIETVLVNAADRVERAPQLCEYEAYVDAAAQAKGWDPSTITATVERLVDNTGNPATDWVPQTCPDSVRPFDVQRLEIIASTPDGGITRTALVVKSNVD